MAVGCSPTAPSDINGTIVLGEQVTAGPEDPVSLPPNGNGTGTGTNTGTDTNTDNGTSPGSPELPPTNTGSGLALHSFSIDNITIMGTFTCGESCVTVIQCTINDQNGTVQAVTADFSSIGGPSAVSLKASGNVWTWSGLVAASIIGSGTVLFIATDDKSAVTTATMPVLVTASAPANPPATITEPEPIGKNIALGRPYTWSTTPNHVYTTDPGDSYQLTDGKIAAQIPPGDNSWVGWQIGRRIPWVTVTIDLGRIQPIQGVSFGTVGGNGLEWPLALGILVSDDGSNYYSAGELTSLGALSGLNLTFVNRSRYCYKTQSLSTHARYVQIVAANYPQMIVDEIEVFRGPESVLSIPFAGSPVTNMASYVRDNKVRAGIIRRIVLDTQDVRQKAINARLAGAPLPADLESSLDGIIEQAVNLNGQDLYRPGVTLSTFKTELPLNDLHDQVFTKLAALWRAQGHAGLTVWQKPAAYDLLKVTDSAGTNLPGVQVMMMQNEFRAGSFCISNATDSPASVNVNVLGLPGGTNPAYVMVHSVAWSDTQVGVAVAAALPELASSQDGYAVRIPPGMTRQVWLTFHPNGIVAGTYTGTITVQGGNLGTFHVPVRMRLSALQFPVQPTLSLGGWDSTDIAGGYAVTQANRDAFVNLLRTHFVNTPWASPAYASVPLGTLGTMPLLSVPSAPAQRAQYFRQFDEWVARWKPQGTLPGAQKYYIMLGVDTSFEGQAMGTPGFNSLVGAWIRNWVAHWQEIGLATSQIALAFTDEPADADRARKVIYWSNAIRATEPSVRLWENPYFSDPTDVDNMATEMFAACDILCPLFKTYAQTQSWQDTYRRQRDTQNKTLQFYQTQGPSMNMDPYSYYRLLAWNCWREGVDTEFFWSLQDTGRDHSDREPGSSWNEYLSEYNYSPLFLDDNSVTSGKQMEAIREGVEDYEYLVMLKKRVAELQAAGSTSSALAGAQQLLLQAADQVLAEAAPGVWYAWSKEKNRTVADDVRIRILDMLESLQ